MRAFEQFRNVGGIGAREGGDFFHRLRISGPTGLMGVVIGDVLKADPGKGLELAQRYWDNRDTSI